MVQKERPSIDSHFLLLAAQGSYHAGEETTLLFYEKYW